MAIVEFYREDLEKLIGRKLTQKDIEDTIPMMGCPLEKIDGEKLVYEVFPNRPDMLSAEGFARSVASFLGRPSKPFGIPLKGPVKVIIDPSVKTVRPFIGAAVVRNVKFTQGMVESLMQVQEKLHETMGRKRRKVAIGIHDMQHVSSPFTYKAILPKSIKFIPLGKSSKMDLEEICEKHEKGITYKGILKGQKLWPIITDRNGDVLSFPPIINGELTKVTMHTKDIFIDVTGTSEQAVMQALNIIATSLADRGGGLETVEVQGKVMPDLKPRPMEIDRDYANKLLDMDLSYGEIATLLSRMGIDFDPKSKKALIPPYRSDIMHVMDLVEEMAISHGYANFDPRIPKVPTIADRLQENENDISMKRLMAGLGFQEIKGMVLSNEDNQFRMMGLEGKAVTLSNSVTAECTICRAWILPSLMKTFTQNMHREYPQRIFELGYSIALNSSTDTGTRNVRKLAAAITGNQATYEEISANLAAFLSSIRNEMRLVPADHPSFIKGRCAAIFSGRTQLGVVGEVCPTVLESWNLEKPVAAFEILVEGLKT